MKSGVVVKIQQQPGMITVNGALNASGVVFTSYKDDSYGGDTNGDGSATVPAPGNWRGIDFTGAGGGSLSSVTMLWGGYYTGAGYRGEVSLVGTGSVSISNSTFSHSDKYGLYVATGNITGSVIRYGGSRPQSIDWGEIFIDGQAINITGSAISHSNGTGIYVYSGSPSIHYNDIFTNHNSYYGLYKNGGSTLDATNNWWGGTGGPKPYGTGNRIFNTTASPWSDVPFTQAGAEAQAMGTDTWCGAFGEPVNTSTGGLRDILCQQSQRYAGKRHRSLGRHYRLQLRQKRQLHFSDLPATIPLGTRLPAAVSATATWASGNGKKTTPPD